MSSKIPNPIPKTHNFRSIAAATGLVLCWTIGLNLPHRSADANFGLAPSPFKPNIPSYRRPWKSHVSSPSDLVLGPIDSEAFCSHYHLNHHSTTSPKEDNHPHPRPPRKIYDLILITPDTSIDALELHLAQTAPFVEYFVLLESPVIADLTPTPDPPPEPEWWERDDSRIREAAQSKAILSATTTRAEDISFLELIWDSLLYPYHDQIIRRTLSQFSAEFAPGKDREAAARNAVYTQVVPLLTGPQKAETGDVLILSDVEEVIKPVILKALRNCEIPQVTTVRTRKYWYSFQWVKTDAIVLGAAPSDGQPDIGNAAGSDSAAGNGLSNELWSHPQVTTYQGTETVLPNDLRNDRSKDEYVFVDGGWTCKLCYGTISETLKKAGTMGLIWHDGPRWKAAGRTVDRVTRGIDLLDRTNLSRIDANPDVPFYLQEDPHRFPWMLDRDAHGANFVDFNEAEYREYLAKQKEVDAEKDVEESATPQLWNLASTQSWNDPDYAPSWDNMPNDELNPPNLDALEDVDIRPAPELSEEDKAFLEEAKADPNTELSEADIGILDQLAGGIDRPAYGED